MFKVYYVLDKDVFKVCYVIVKGMFDINIKVKYVGVFLIQ